MPRAAARRAIKQDRAVKTRQEILNSAITLFARRGILATTMADLARAIHMTPGALYWHFPTKEDLLLAAIEELNTHFLASFRPVVRKLKTMTAQEQLLAFTAQVARYLDEHREHGILYGMVGAEAAENSEDVAHALRQALTFYVDVITRIIRYGQEQTKEFRTDVDARTIGNTFIFGNIGVVVQHNLFRDTLTYTPIVTSFNEVLVKGLLRTK